MAPKKGSDVPNVNEARDRIVKRKELAKSKEVEGEKTAPENATSGMAPKKGHAEPNVNVLSCL